MATNRCARLLIISLCLLVMSRGSQARAEAPVIPPECTQRDISTFPKVALRNGLFSLRSQFIEIAAVIRQNSGDQKRVTNVLRAIDRQSTRALQRALDAVNAYPNVITTCPDETVCTRVELNDERQRIIDTARALADVTLRLIHRFPNYLGEDPIFVEERVESRLNAFFDGIDFLPPFTFVCPGSREIVTGPPTTCPSAV